MSKIIAIANISFNDIFNCETYFGRFYIENIISSLEIKKIDVSNLE